MASFVRELLPHLPTMLPKTLMGVYARRLSMGNGSSRRWMMTNPYAGSAALIDHASLLLGLLGTRYPAFMLSKHRCVACIRAKKLLRDLGVKYQLIQLDGLSRHEKQALHAVVKAGTGSGSVPRIFVQGECIGGYDQVQRKHWTGELMPLLVQAGVAQEQTEIMEFEAGNPQL